MQSKILVMDIKSWLKKNWWKILIVLFFLFGISYLISVIIKSGAKINNHTAEKQMLTKQRDSFQRNEQLANQVNASLSEANKQGNRLKDSLITELTAVKKQLGQSIGKNVSLADQVRAAKLLRDTIRYVLACDSLASENAGLVYLVEEYQIYTDSLFKVMTANDLRKDSILTLRLGLYNDLKKSYQLADSSYNNLFDSYSKQSKQLKRERVKTKLTAVLGLAITILALIK